MRKSLADVQPGTTVRTWHDDGRGGTWAHGEVRNVAPKTFVVIWESGLRQRIHKERHGHLVEWVCMPRDFELGYDQAVQEVLDEVCERDPDMAQAIAKKYPVWGRICANRKYGHT